MSLRLGRKPGQSLMIGDDVKVTVLTVIGNKVTLDISAPISIPVHRQEVYDDIQKNGLKKQAPLISGVPSEKWEPKEGEEYCEVTLSEGFPKGSIVKWGCDGESFWYRTEEDLPKGSRIAFPAACAFHGHCSITHDERLTGESEGV